MILIGLIIGIIFTLCGFRFYHKTDNDAWVFLIILGVTAALGSIAGGLSLAQPLVDARDVDERIAMYEEQNAEIESQVETAVKLYMSHEDEVFESASPEDYITLVSLYPDLKSDTLMQKQIEVYVENNKKICELKEEKITAQRSKFWLYFGR